MRIRPSACRTARVVSSFALGGRVNFSIASRNVCVDDFATSNRPTYRSPTSATVNVSAGSGFEPSARAHNRKCCVNSFKLW